MTRVGTPARLPKSPLRRRLGHGEIGRVGRRIAANRRERRAACGAANRKRLGADCFGQFALDGFQAAWTWFSGSLLAVWDGLKMQKQPALCLPNVQAAFSARTAIPSIIGSLSYRSFPKLEPFSTAILGKDYVKPIGFKR